MENVRRIYVEKKTGYAVKAQELKEDLIGYLNMSGIEDVRMFIRYDVENISDEVFEQACRTVFSEPPVDILYRETIETPANHPQGSGACTEGSGQRGSGTGVSGLQ